VTHCHFGGRLLDPGLQVRWHCNTLPLPHVYVAAAPPLSTKSHCIISPLTDSAAQQCTKIDPGAIVTRSAGSARVQALRYVAVCVGLAVVHTLVAVKVSYAQKHFSTALSEKNKGVFYFQASIPSAEPKKNTCSTWQSRQQGLLSQHTGTWHNPSLLQITLQLQP